MKKTTLIIAVISCFIEFYPVQADEDYITNKIEIIGTTPLSGIGLPISHIPSNVQVVTDKSFRKQNSLTVADYMNDNLEGVSVTETQSNPFQPDVWFRGFSASPLLGTPQGLSIYLDGVRVNEPFGDAVNWDLIPMNAISSMSVIPGTNPVYGLNTLGGAISLQTKSGRTHKGASIQSSGGSWGRFNLGAEYGGVSKDNSVDYFLSLNGLTEDGWRKYSQSDIRQAFVKLGWQNETTRINLSYTGVSNDLNGNGLMPLSLTGLAGRDGVYTYPDNTKNELSFLNLTGDHLISEAIMLSGNMYYRHSQRKSLNGDINNNWAEAGDPTGALNRSRVIQNSLGFNLQTIFNQAVMDKKNQLTVGTAFDYSKIKFNQHSEDGLLNADRSVTGIGTFDAEAETQLRGTTNTWSLFATDTLSLSDFWHLTLSGRYNRVQVSNRDILIPSSTTPGSLTSDHIFQRINPAIGLTWTPLQSLNIYGSYNEGNRAPTSMELGCADPTQPCRLPNSMAGDPPLKQVIVRTFETGARGALYKDWRWSLSLYHTENSDDIQFISSNSVTNGMGYFQNVGKTRRIGIDSKLSGQWDKLSWTTGYSFVDAIYQSGFQFASDANSSADDNGLIDIRKGDRVANIPQHQFKARVDYQLTPAWRVGGNMTVFSNRYLRGNENDGHTGGIGKVAGFNVINLDTLYQINQDWSVFAKAVNIFDVKYNTGGMLGESSINPNTGAFSATQHSSAFVAPGSPRAGWIGVRWEWGRK